MKKAFSTGWTIFFILLVIGAITITGYIYVRGGLAGMTSTEAQQVVPIPKNIELNAESQENGVLLEWNVTKDTQGEYYDVYRRIPGLESGWGERVERIDIKANSLDSYEYLDTSVETGHAYIYQVILVRLSNGFEIKEQASNSIQITFK